MDAPRLNNNEPTGSRRAFKSRDMTSFESTDSEWGAESLNDSQDSEVFESILQRSLGSSDRTGTEYNQGLPRPPEGRRRYWSDSSAHRQNSFRASKYRSSVSTAYTSSLSSSVSHNDASGDRSFSVSQWMESWGDNVFDSTVAADGDMTVLELERDGRSSPGKSATYSRQDSIASSDHDQAAETLTQEQLGKALSDKPPPSRTLSNSDLIQMASDISPSLAARKREQFKKGESWNGSSIDSEMSIRSVTSVDDLLDVVNDPEEFLLNLGFGVSTANPLERIPRRFLDQESEALGITVEKFLEQMREKDRGYNFCLTGGLRGLERFLKTQMMNSGFDFSPSSSPQLGSPQHEPSPLSRFSNGHYNNSDHQVIRPLPVTSSSELPTQQPRYISKQLSKDSIISTDGSVISEDSSFDSDFSTSGDWSDSTLDSWRSKPKGKKLPMVISGLDTVEEELESQLRAKSPCPPGFHSQTARVDPTASLPARIDPTQSKTPPINNNPQAESDRGVVGEELVKLSTGQEGNAAPIWMREAASGEAANARVKPSRLTEDAAQDSFEFEEISNSEENQAQNGREGKDVLTWNESQQSDSSGFADEGTESVSPASPQQEPSGDEDTTGKTARHTEDVNSEENNNLTPAANRSHTERQDDDDNIVPRGGDNTKTARKRWSRLRAGSFPTLKETRPSSSGPKSVLQILELLQKNYKKAEKEVKALAAGEKRKRLFSKMDTIDPDEYSFSGSRGRVGGGDVAMGGENGGMEGITESAEEEVSDGAITLSTKERRSEEAGTVSYQLETTEAPSVFSEREMTNEPSRLSTEEAVSQEGARVPSELETTGTGIPVVETYTSGIDRLSPGPKSMLTDLPQEKLTQVSGEDVFIHEQAKGDPALRSEISPSSGKHATPDVEEQGSVGSVRSNPLEKLLSVDVCDRLSGGNADEQGRDRSWDTLKAELEAAAKLRSEQMQEHELHITPDSQEAQEIQAQRELQDLKLMQRALVKYKQELWELDEWSGQITNNETVDHSDHVRKELSSLASLRQKVKDEVQKMEGTLENQMVEIISTRGAMDTLSHRFAHWSYSHIDVLNKMVSLMKEQDSLRKHLAKVRAEKSSEKGMKSAVLPSIASESIYKTLSKTDLIEELVGTQLELARLKVMSRTEMAAAIVEMKRCIVSDIRKEVDQELRIMQWQIRDRDDQIEELKELMKKQNINQESETVSSSTTVEQQGASDEGISGREESTNTLSTNPSTEEQSGT